MGSTGLLPQDPHQTLASPNSGRTFWTSCYEVGLRPTATFQGMKVEPRLRTMLRKHLSKPAMYSQFKDSFFKPTVIKLPDRQAAQGLHDCLCFGAGAGLSRYKRHAAFLEGEGRTSTSSEQGTCYKHPSFHPVRPTAYKTFKN